MTTFHLRIKNPHGYTGAQPNLCGLVSYDFTTSEAYEAEERENLPHGDSLCPVCVAVYKQRHSAGELRVGDKVNFKDEFGKPRQSIISRIVPLHEYSGKEIAYAMLSDGRGSYVRIARDLKKVGGAKNLLLVYPWRLRFKYRSTVAWLRGQYRLAFARAKLIPGRFLSNTGDPTWKYAQMYYHLSYEAFCDRTGKLAQWGWEMHLRWINENLIRPPKATPFYTREQLEEQGMIGLYQPLCRTLSDWNQFKLWIRYSRIGEWVEANYKRYNAWADRIIHYSSRDRLVV